MGEPEKAIEDGRDGYMKDLNHVKSLDSDKQSINYFKLGDEFFLIDSENLQNVKTKLYGFSVQDSGIYEDENLTEDASAGLNGCGTYIYIYSGGGTITIRQDMNGSYGIYLFRKDEYFALSNSFFLLLDFLKTRFSLTLNRDYANHILAADLASHAFSETPVNEISIVARNAVIKIDIGNKDFKLDYIDYKENSLPLDSAEGIEVLDNWFRRWTTIFRNIKAQTNQIMVDLSGGFDSRITFLLILMSGIHLDEITVHSTNDTLHVHAEDYEIASAIADCFEFKLNNYSNFSERCVHFSLEDCINIAFYTKMTFHKEMYFRYNKWEKKRFWLSGSGGEIVRGYPNLSAKDFLDKDIKRCLRYSKSISDEMSQSIANIISSVYKVVGEKYDIGEDDSLEYPSNLYRETRCRSHYGKAAVEAYFANVYHLSPYLDPDLWKLQLNDLQCPDTSLLMAIIYVRYCPQLLNYKFEGGRFIHKETIQFAQAISNKYPVSERSFNIENKEFNIITADSEVQMYINEHKMNHAMQGGAPDDYLKKVFDSTRLRKLFAAYFDEEIYSFALSSFERNKFFPMRECYSVIGITKVIEDIIISSGNNKSIIRSMDRFIDGNNYKCDEGAEERFKDYITARLDIKLQNNAAADLELLSVSDDRATISKPQWLQKEGTGYVVESHRGFLALVFRASAGGQLTVSLRGKDIRDSMDKRIPYWINYRNMRYNDESVFKEVKPAWHDAPICLKSSVKAGEVVRLYVEWASVLHKADNFTLVEPKIRKENIPNAYKTMEGKNILSDGEKPNKKNEIMKVFRRLVPPSRSFVEWKFDDLGNKMVALWNKLDSVKEEQ